MEKNHIFGFILLFTTLFVWTYISAPDKAELERQQYVKDSIVSARLALDSLNSNSVKDFANTNTTVPAIEVSDSIKLLMNSGTFGPFAPASFGEEKDYILENDKLKVTFTNKGGRIKSAFLKEYTKAVEIKGEKGKKKEYNMVPVVLFDDERNKFNYHLPIANVPSGSVSTENLYFTVKQDDKSITFTANTSMGSSFSQTYKLSGDYKLDYDLDFRGLGRILDAKSKTIALDWQNYLSSYEKNTKFESQYSAIYYKEYDDSVSDCGCMSDDKEELKDTKMDWVSHANQYFNTSLIATGEPFAAAVLESVLPENENADYMEKLSSNIEIPVSEEHFEMAMYLGPNVYNNLKTFDVSLEDIIPFGSSIFGTINRYAIRPVFDFFSGWVGSLGLAIVIIIFLLKMLLYPLMYKMLHSQALMGALKPELAHLNDKYKDDAQKKQMETMKIYREFGVSPLGGCMPMMIQMPIWYALFRFFPASISFRQESFLWAEDLSSYDDFFHFATEIPFLGDHLSLFTILYSVSMLIYTYYNTKHMDMSANPAMKYMQYLMPVMFFGFFNSYASALTCYMFFSNVINIAQTVITKKFVFKDEKLLAELKVKKAKPKKKGGFQSKLQDALKQQQEAQAKKGKK
ncbi:MAG: membrane protein insertase YidC [Saprospiraceae bacterium]